jgi:hypothetical protein
MIIQKLEMGTKGAPILSPFYASTREELMALKEVLKTLGCVCKTRII